MSPTHSPTTTAKSRRTLGAALGLALVVAAAPFLNSASAAQPAGDATASGETAAVTGANATAKDSAIWVHPTDPTKSLILGANDTRLEVYDLAGDVTAQAGVPSPGASNPPDGVVTGVDVRSAVSIGGSLAGDVATVVGKSLVRFYLIDPATGKLANTTIDAAGVKAETFTTENHSSVCMYKSPVSGKTYAFVLANNGEMGQLELIPSAANAQKIDIAMVRGGKAADVTWDAVPTVDHEAGGCVVDDESRTLYVSDKTGGIFKFGAEPTDAKTGTLVDDIANGHLLAKIQGLEIVKTAPGNGYLMAASFNDAPTTDPSQFTAYDLATGAFVRTFKVLDGAADMCQQSTSISAAGGNLGAGFTSGLFVCNDKKNRPTNGGNNTDPNNYKMASLDLIVDMAPPTTTTTAPPVVVTTPTTTPVQSQNNNRSGYWMVGSDGRVFEFGEARHYGNVNLAAGAQSVDLEPTPSGNGYWVVDDLGHVFPRGDAKGYGDVDRALLTSVEVVTSLSSTKTGNGYWVFTSLGRVIPFGDAVSYGDMSKVKLNGPVLDSIPSASGKGYYMVGSDGGIFSFGDAVFKGSMGGKTLNKPVQSLVPDADGIGYWLVASDGGIFAFDAEFRGSMGAVKLNKPVTGMVRYGNGYLMVGEDGGIFSFSDKKFVGSLGDNPPARPITSVAVLDAP